MQDTTEAKKGVWKGVFKEVLSKFGRSGIN